MRQKRFVVWRRSTGNLEGLNTLPGAINEAKEIVEDGDYDEVVVLEVKKVVSSKPVVTPVNVKDF